MVPKQRHRVSSPVNNKMEKNRETTEQTLDSMILFHIYNNKQRDCSLKNHKGKIAEREKNGKPCTKPRKCFLNSRYASKLPICSDKKNNGLI
jgi:hypothetical protein